jgi:hypothetical protein
VLLRRVLIALVIQIIECGDQLAARLARPNDLVDEAPGGRDIRIRELFAELLDLFGPGGDRIGRGVQLAFI